jgi:CTP:molybdopterin cytidylyltransferase MocA
MSDRARIAGLITAGGASERMGEPKALLDWGGKPLLRHQCDVLQGFAHLVVVLGADAERLRAVDLDPEVEVVINARWSQGRSGSLACGARALESMAWGLDGVLVAGVDQPLDPAVVGELVSALDPDRDAAVVPTYQGQRGHPVLLGRPALAELAQVGRYPDGLRGLLAAYQATTRLVPVDSRAILLDLNTPGDYAKATR